jgi:hypothetical protein
LWSRERAATHIPYRIAAPSNVGLNSDTKQRRFAAVLAKINRRASAYRKVCLRPKSKCDGTVEDHRAIALDVRELIRKHVFEQPVGSVFQLNIAFPWLRLMRLNSGSLDLELITGRAIIVPLVSASCGVMGERLRLECPLCGRRVCVLHHLDGRVACRRCNNLWYAAQRVNSTARKFLTTRKIRRQLGDYGQVPSARLPPKPRGMWRRTYTRHCEALTRIERKLRY